jgi:hypothetical protein
VVTKSGGVRSKLIDLALRRLLGFVPGALRSNGYRFEPMCR